jgi:hypothetical protein
MPMPISEPQSPTIQLDPEEAKLHRQLMDLAGGFWPLGKPTPLGSTMDGPVSAGTLNNGPEDNPVSARTPEDRPGEEFHSVSTKSSEKIEHSKMEPDLALSEILEPNLDLSEIWTSQVQEFTSGVTPKELSHGSISLVKDWGKETWPLPGTFTMSRGSTTPRSATPSGSATMSTLPPPGTSTMPEGSTPPRRATSSPPTSPGCPHTSLKLGHASFLGGGGVLRGSPCLSSGIHLLSLIRFSGLYGDLNIPPVISATLSGKGKRASYSPRKERRTSAVMREILPL